MLFRTKFLAALASIPLCFLSPPLEAQVEPSLEKIRVVYSAGGSHNTVWIPYEAGIFRKYGLDVELLFVAARAQPERFIEPRFFRELEQEGFIQRLWQ